MPRTIDAPACAYIVALGTDSSKTMSYDDYVKKPLSDLPTRGHKRFETCKNCSRNGRFYEYKTGTVVCRHCGVSDDFITDNLEDSEEFHQYIDKNNDGPYLGSFLSAADMALIVGCKEGAAKRFVSATQQAGERKYWLTRPVAERICETLQLPIIVSSKTCSLLGRFTSVMKKPTSEDALALACVIIAARKCGIYVDIDEAMRECELDCRDKTIVDLLEHAKAVTTVPFVSKEMYMRHYARRHFLTVREENIAKTVMHDFITHCREIVHPKTMVCIALCIALYPRDSTEFTLRNMAEEMRVVYASVEPRVVRFCRATGQKQYLRVLDDPKSDSTRNGAHPVPKPEKRPKGHANAKGGKRKRPVGPLPGPPKTRVAVLPAGPGREQDVPKRLHPDREPGGGPGPTDAHYPPARQGRKGPVRRQPAN